MYKRYSTDICLILTAIINRHLCICFIFFGKTSSKKFDTAGKGQVSDGQGDI